jgi:hypothetical protein
MIDATPRDDGRHTSRSVARSDSEHNPEQVVHIANS